MRAQSAQTAATPAKKITKEQKMYVSRFIPRSGQSALGDRVIQVPAFESGLDFRGCDGFGWNGEGTRGQWTI